MAGLLGPSEGLDPATPVEGLGLLNDVAVPGPFKRGLGAGIAGVKSSLAGAGALIARGANVVVPTEVGAGIEQSLLAKSAAESEAASAGAIGYQDVLADPSRAAEYFKFLLGQAVPSLATMAVGGGLGALAGRAVAGQAGMAAARAAGVVAPAVRAGALTGAVLPDVALEAGSIFPEAVKEGVENPGTRALVGGAVAGALDFVPLLAAEKYLKPIGKGGFGAMARGAAKGAPVGAALEGSQEMLQSLVERAAAGKSLTDPEAVSDYIESFMGGAAPGSIFGGAIGARRQSTAPVQETPPSTNTEQPPEVNDPNLSTIVPDLGTATPAEQFAYFTQQHTAATQQLATLEPAVAAAQQAHDAAVARREELTAEAKLPIGERRTMSEITVEKKAIAKQIEAAKKETERLGGELYNTRAAIAGLTPQLEAAQRLIAGESDNATVSPVSDAVPNVVVPDEGLNPAIAPPSDPIVSDTIQDPSVPVSDEVHIDRAVKGVQTLMRERGMLHDLPASKLGGDPTPRELAIERQGGRGAVKGPNSAQMAAVEPHAMAVIEPIAMALAKTKTDTPGGQAKIAKAMTASMRSVVQEAAKLQSVEAAQAHIEAKMPAALKGHGVQIDAPDMAKAVSAAVGQAKTQYSKGAMSSKKVGTAFTSLVDKLGRDNVNELLSNWNDSELSEDGSTLINYPGRDGRYSKGMLGGKVKVGKGEFLSWLHSNAPFNPAEFDQSDEWKGMVETARAATGMSQDDPDSRSWLTQRGDPPVPAGMHTPREIDNAKFILPSGRLLGSGDETHEYISDKLLGNFATPSQAVNKLGVVRVNAAQLMMASGVATAEAPAQITEQQFARLVKYFSQPQHANAEKSIEIGGRLHLLNTGPVGSALRAAFNRVGTAESNAALTQDEFDTLPEPAKFAAVDEFNRVMMAKGRALRERLLQLIGNDPTLKISTFMATPNSPIGSYTRVGPLKSVITLALNAKEELSIADHEGYHYAEDRLLDARERRIVANAMKPGRPLFQQLLKKLQAYDQANGTNLTDEVSAIPAEARAYAFEFWRRGELQAEGPVARAFQIIRNFLEKVSNLVRGLGFTSIEDVFTALDRGQFAERTANSGEITENTGELPMMLRQQAFSKSADYTQTPEFKRWFGDSKVVDAEGKPLVVYHGTTADVIAFDPSKFGSGNDSGYFAKGFYFAGDADSASGYSHGGAVYPVYLSIKNPFVWKGGYFERIKAAFQGYGRFRGAAEAAVGKVTPRTSQYGLSVFSLVNTRGALPAAIQTSVLSRAGLTLEMLRHADMRQAHQRGTTAAMAVSPYFDGAAYDVEKNAAEKLRAEYTDKLVKAVRDELVSRGYDGITVDNVKVNQTYHEYVAFSPTQIKSAIGNTGAFDPTNPDIRFSKGASNDPFNPKPTGLRSAIKTAQAASGGYGVLRKKLQELYDYVGGEFTESEVRRLNDEISNIVERIQLADPTKVTPLNTVLGNALDAINSEISDVFAVGQLRQMFPQDSDTQFSRGAVATATRSAFAEMTTRFQNGELEREQYFLAVTKLMDQAKTNIPTVREMAAAVGDESVGAFTRARTYLATGNYIGKSSKGYKNVLKALSAQEQYKDRLIADGSEVGLSKWHGATQEDREVTFNALLKRRIAGYLKGSPEFNALMEPLTPSQRAMFAQVAGDKDNEGVIAKFLQLEFGAETNAFKQIMTVPEFEQWQVERAASVQGLIDNGYVPERRYGDHTVKLIVDVVDAEGKVTPTTVAREQFETGAAARVRMEQYAAEIKAAGSNVRVEQGIMHSVERDSDLSLQQVLDLTRRQGIRLGQVEIEKLSRALLAADSMRRNRMMRSDNVPGYSRNGWRVLNEWVTGMSGRVAHSTFSSTVNDALDGKPVTAYIHSDQLDGPSATVKDGQPVVSTDTTRNLWEEDGPKSGFYRDLADKRSDLVLRPQDSSVLSTKLKATAMSYFIGGSLGGGMVQMFSVPMNTLPYLSQHTDYTNAFSTTLAAWGYTLKNAGVLRDLNKLKDPDFKIDGLTPDLRQALILAAQDGTNSSTEIHQIMGISRGGLLSQSRTVQRALDVWMAPFKFGENTSRVAAFIAAWNIGTKEKKLSGRALYEFAKTTVDETQNRYDPVNRPTIASHPIGSLLFMFRSFPLFVVEMVETMFRQNPKSAVYMLLGLVALTGVQGLPFAEDILDIVDVISQKLFGSPFNSRRAMRNMLKDASEAMVGVDLSNLFMRGLINDMIGLNFATRVGGGDMIPGTRMGAADMDYGRAVEQILGAPISMVVAAGGQIPNLVGGVLKGDVDQILSALRAGGPVAVRNLIKGVEQMDNGFALDARGRRLNNETTGLEALWQSIGVSSAALTKIYDLDAMDRQTTAFYTQVSADMQARLIRALRDGDTEKVQEIYEARTKWNTEHPDMPLMPNAASTRRGVMMAGVPLNERTLRMLPRALRGSSVANELANE